MGNSDDKLKGKKGKPYFGGLTIVSLNDIDDNEDLESELFDVYNLQASAV